MKEMFVNGDYAITTDKREISAERVHEMLKTSYWAADRPLEVIKKSIDGSHCYGIFHKGILIGFARIITDYATFSYLCDVIIEEAHRKNGLGKWLVSCIIEDPGLLDVKAMMLATKDAHGLYSQFGFKPLEIPEKYMLRKELP